ncbi:hypothetical protein C6P44_003222 [Monosporozyma unispora]|nr:hypothetical protein C6P44_003222 [Kazachstania unispora]
MSNVVKSVLPLDSVIFNDDDVFPQKFDDLINGVLDVYRNHSPETLEVELKNLRNQYDIIECLNSLHDILHRKHYIEVASEKRSFDDMTVEESTEDPNSSDATNNLDPLKKKRLISYNRLINLFWEYCDAKVDYIVHQFMNIRVPNILQIKPLDVKSAITAYRTTYFSIWRAMQPLFPIIQYVSLNYPHIFKKKVSKDSTFDDYLNRKIYNIFKSCLNDSDTSFEEFLKTSFLPPIMDEEWIMEVYNKTTLLRFAFLYGEEIDGQELSEFYLNQLENHIKSFDYSSYFYQINEAPNYTGYSSRNVDKKLNFEGNFFNELKKQSLLAYMFSPSWMEKVKLLYVERVLLREDMIANCYNYYLGKEDADISKDIGVFRYAYILMGRKSEADQICENIIYGDIKKLYNPTDKSSLTEVFDRVRRQVIFFSRIKPNKKRGSFCGCDYECECYDTEVPKFFNSAYTKFFGNEMKLIQAILKYIEFKEKLSLTHDADLEHFSENLELILRKLCISSSITNLYSQSLFRHILMNYDTLVEQISQGHEAMKSIDDVVSAFTSIYINKSDYVSLMWQHFKEHAVKVARVNHTLNNIGEDELKINPFILPLTDIPKIYQQMNEENTSDKVRLPKEIQDIWNDFEAKFLDKIIPQSKNKTIQLMYGLQYCDVETQFRTNEGEPLHLELTLYQTCVLNEFNGSEKVSFSHLVDTLQMDAPNVKSILNSFLNIGLVKVNPDKTFSVNNLFKADESKIKNGSLRVVVGKVRKESLVPSSPYHNTTTQGHAEGSSEVWRREVIKAHIARVLKLNKNSMTPYNADTLHELCIKDYGDVSRVEFNAALESALKETYIHKTLEGRYTFSA